MLKKELRFKYKALRKSLSEAAIEKKSLAIVNQLLSIAIWQKNYFHVFLHLLRDVNISKAITNSAVNILVK